MLILASASKARSSLLDNAGIPHEVIPSKLDEKQFSFLSAHQLVQTLAVEKGKAVLSLIDENLIHQQFCTLLACDSIFLFEGESFGKPIDQEEAINRWHRFSSKSGSLITGHALFSLSKSKKKSRLNPFDQLEKKVVSSKVYFSNLTSKEIENYVLSGEPMSCAGGFSLEGRASSFINKIDGCYSNILGISMPWLRIALQNYK